VGKLINVYEYESGEFVGQYSTFTEASRELGLCASHLRKTTLNPKNKIFRPQTKGYYAEVEFIEKEIPKEDEDLYDKIFSLEKSLQKARDENRLLRKTKRENNRSHNVLEKLNEELVEILENNKFKNSIVHESLDGNAWGIVQLSDLHGNETVDIVGNKFNFEVMGKRLRLKVLKDIKIFQSYGIKDILIVMSGDLLNSSRRLEEILLNAENSSKAQFIVADMLSQVVIEYNKYFNVTISGICGNESRLTQDIYYTKQIASNNFDYTIKELMSRNLSDCPGIRILETTNPNEELIKVNDQMMLVCHGHNKKHANLESEITKTIGKWAKKGILIRHVILGHIHSVSNGSNYSRSGGLPGDNDYNFYALNISGRASQNSLIVHRNGNIDTIGIDLQEYDEIENGYTSCFKTTNISKKKDGYLYHEI